MANLIDYKSSCLDYLHTRLAPEIERIQLSRDTHQKQAKSVNLVISRHLDSLVSFCPKAFVPKTASKDS